MAKKEMDGDVAQDKKMIKKAFGMHDKQLHENKKTDLSKLKKGGMAVKKMAKGGVVSEQEKAMGRNLARVANQGSKK